MRMFPSSSLPNSQWTPSPTRGYSWFPLLSFLLSFSFLSFLNLKPNPGGSSWACGLKQPISFHLLRSSFLVASILPRRQPSKGSKLVNDQLFFFPSQRTLCGTSIFRYQKSLFPSLCLLLLLLQFLFLVLLLKPNPFFCLPLPADT